MSLSLATPNFSFFFFVACLTTIALVYTANQKAPSASISSPGNNAKLPPPHSREFKNFQKVYLFVYFCVMAGDWLQGPYVYALYASYGFTQHDIAILFVAGFGSSMVFGTFIGSLADKFGRKKFCLVYVLTYIVSCLSKHVNSFSVLLVGRLLGGISTSLLFSVFDAWMINEHNTRSFQGAWLSDTFSTAILGNSCVAIAAGLVANFVAEMSPLHRLFGAAEEATHIVNNDGSLLIGGFCAPFDVAIIILSIGGLYIQSNWGENFGSQDSGDENFTIAIRNGYKTIMSNDKVFLCGAISSLFEGSMFTFVFMWTPALSPSAGEDGLPLGLIFATFMVCCMGGSSLFTVIAKKVKIEEISKYTFFASALALSVPVFTTDSSLIFVGFLLFEGCVGMYFPAMGTLKSSIVPESQRSAIYNIFRVPLNVIVLVVLLAKMEMANAFLCCTTMLLGAAYCQYKLCGILQGEEERKRDTEGDEESLIAASSSKGGMMEMEEER